MARRLILILLIASSASAADNPIFREVKRYAHDAKDLATQPLRWDQRQWTRFAEGTAAVGVLYAADRHLYGEVQLHRSDSTNRFAKTITPFGGGRANQISALLIVAGALSHNANLRDAGRDSLESEFWAAGVVTPLLKRAFGRSRPSEGVGARQFRPFSNHESFPSGHATNAFALATGIASHYDNWIVPAIVYSVASGVAFSRVNDRAHFPSDVVAGALIGRAVAKGVFARHAGKNKKMTWQIVPTVQGRGNLILGFSARLR